MSEMTYSEQRSTFRHGLFGLSVRGNSSDEFPESEVVNMSLGGIQLKLVTQKICSLKEKEHLDEELEIKPANLESNICIKDLPREQGVDETQAEEKTFVLIFRDGNSGGIGEVELKGEPIWLKRKGENQCRMGVKWSALSIPKRLMIKHWLKYYASS